MLALLGKIWNKHPDLRLGQLIINCIPGGDLYYLEDDKLVKHLTRLYDVDTIGHNPYKFNLYEDEMPEKR
jgi:hypothetical protein